MTLDINWNVQAISALDVSALAASENIANANTENYRPVRAELEDGLGGKGVRVADVVELTNGIDTNGPGLPLVPSARETEYESGLIRPVSSTGEGGFVDLAREMTGLMQVERAFSANVAAAASIDRSTGSLVDMIA